MKNNPHLNMFEVYHRKNFTRSQTRRYKNVRRNFRTSLDSTFLSIDNRKKMYLEKRKGLNSMQSQKKRKMLYPITNKPNIDSKSILKQKQQLKSYFNNVNKCIEDTAQYDYSTYTSGQNLSDLEVKTILKSLLIRLSLNQKNLINSNELSLLPESVKQNLRLFCNL